MNELRAVVLDILDDVTVDALVTVAHAEEMADEIVAALGRRGLTIASAEGGEAGLIVADPLDPAVVERVARVLARQMSSTIQIPDVATYVEQHWRHHVNRARAVLATLAAPGGEGHE